MLANHRTAVDEHGCGKVDNPGRRPGRRSRRPSPSAASLPRARPDGFLSALTGSLNHLANMLSTLQCRATCWSMPRSSASLRLATHRLARPWSPRRCLAARTRPNPGPAPPGPHIRHHPPAGLPTHNWPICSRACASLAQEPTVRNRRCRAGIRCCVMAGSVWRRDVSGGRPLSFGVGGPKRAWQVAMVAGQGVSSMMRS